MDSVIKLRGRRFIRSIYRFRSVESKFTLFLKKTAYQHNRYQKTKNPSRLITPLLKYDSPLAKGWLYCYDLVATARKFFAVCKSIGGIIYFTPLIDSVALGDKLRLYRSAARLYYFVKAGSLTPIIFLRSGFMVCQLGISAARYAMSAGTYVLLNNFTTSGFSCTLPSGAKKVLTRGYYGLLGRNAAPLSYKQYLGKASINNSHYSRIIVRSCAKNPVDHPNGGRTRGKTLIKTPWGKVARSGK